MTMLGVFRDDFYNPVSVLTTGQFTATAAASGVLAASAIAGASENYVSSSGATALTLDTAANIIARLQNAVAVQLAASGAVAAGTQGGAPPGLPNLLNVTFMFYIRNTNAGTLTLTLPTGITLANGVATIATTVERQYMITVTGPNSLVLNDLGGATVT